MRPKCSAHSRSSGQRIVFEFKLKKPNDWATAYMKVCGFKDKGYTAEPEWEHKVLAKAEELSSYQFLRLEIGAAGINQVRIELIGESNGIDTHAHPSADLNITDQFQPYRILIGDFKQPEGDWVKRKTTAQEVLKKLTAVQINVFSVPAKGLVVIDKLAFER